MPLAAFPKCFLSALVTDKTMSVEEWITMAARDLDIDGLEFYWGFTPGNPEERRRLRVLMRDLGFAMPMMCYSPDFIQRDTARLAAEIAQQRLVIRATAELGGRFCRVLSGQWKPDVSRNEGLAMAAEGIRASLAAAKEAGICLILENHYKDGFWQYPEFAQQMDDFIDLLERIPAGPNFGVNYDPSNALIAGDDPIALLEAVKHRVVTMHASDRTFAGGSLDELRKLDRDPRQGYAPFLRHGIIGRGSLDYDRIFSILRGVGFTGWISIEDGDDPEVGMDHLRESANFLRNKMAAHGLP
jgi:sugar phosphate isomerase/epimerase